MKQGSKLTSLAQKKDIVDQVARMVADGVGRLKAYENAGISDVTYYKYRRELGSATPLRLVDGPKKEAAPVMGLQFSVVDGDEARLWVVNSKASRFDELKQGLVERLAELRKSEALSFPVPENADKDEVQSIITACKRAVLLANLPWKMRYSSSKRLIVALHKSKFPKSENGDKQ